MKDSVFLPVLHTAVDTRGIWTYCMKLAVESIFILGHNFHAEYFRKFNGRFLNKRPLRCPLGDIKFHANKKERVEIHFRSLQFLSYEENTKILKLSTVRIP